MKKIIKKQEPKVAFLIPAHNEEKVIGSTIKSVLKLTNSKNIFIVNDGSVDETSKISKKFTKNVLNIYSNLGKAGALNKAIEKFQLVKKYEFIMIVDADCQIDPNFLKEALPVFKKDKHNKIACVVGKVIGNSRNWVTSYRVWEYEVAQTIHKAAQSYLNSIIVCPGPSTIYRSKIFKQIKIPDTTLTEDMDLTFQIHRQKLGSIKFCGKAKVMTQDPATLKDFIRQLDRWYTGFWQCVKKHQIPWGGQPLDAEVGLLATEGLYNGILVAMIVLILPMILIKNPSLLIWPLLFDFCLFVVPTMLLAAIQRKAFGIFKYILPFYGIRLITSFVFLKSFIKVVMGIDLNMNWFKASRYSFEYYRISNSNIFTRPVFKVFNLVAFILAKGKEAIWVRAQ